MIAPDTGWAKALLDAVADPDNPLLAALSNFEGATRRLSQLERLNELESSPAREQAVERAQLELRDAKAVAFEAAAKLFGEALPVASVYPAVVQSGPVDWSRSGRAA